MANVINFELPKDEIVFSTDVSVMIAVPQGVQNDEESTTMLAVDEKRNGVITKTLEGPNGDPEYRKTIQHISSVRCRRSSRNSYIFDITFTLSNGSTLHYPCVYTFTLFPSPELGV